MSLPTRSSHRLAAHLDAALAILPAGPILIAYSGGADSHVLLHALAQMPAARARGLRALHVDHGLHHDSARWAAHCREVATSLDIALDIVAVTIDKPVDSGPENAARSARIGAFENALRGNEILALAHHRDDQAETVLLKLLRGAGPEGLGGMRSLRSFGPGLLWRPLLDLPRAALREYAQVNALRWIDDPSNADTRLRRNFLRNDVLPLLKQRWPDTEIALAHSALWARSASQFIQEQALRALAQLQRLDPATLDWRGWLELPDALRDPTLRLWLRGLDLAEPSHLHVGELERQLRDAGEDRLPCVSFDGTELRRYRELLYAMPALLPMTDTSSIDWDGAPLALPAGGQLELSPARELRPMLQVGYRRGGERMRVAGSQHTRDLRLLLQESGTPPWQRARIPLIYRDSELLAVGDLYLSEAGQRLWRELDTHVVWSPAVS